MPQRLVAAAVVVAAAALLSLGCSSGESGVPEPLPTLDTLGTAVPALVPPPQGAVTADQILAAWATTGVDLGEVRDNTTGNCAPKPDGLGCVELITTDVASIYRWDETATPVEFVQVNNEGRPAPDLPVAPVGPYTVVRWAEGGSTPVYDRSALESALVPLRPG
jgi:hypothetical protein